MKRLPLCICVILVNAAIAGEGPAQAGTAGVDPWVKPLLPKRIAKSRFPSPQLWPAKSGQFDLPLTIADSSPSGGRRMISTGVPLMVGQVKDVSELRLVAKSSGGTKALPAQFRVLARWWRFDNSVRWVLVDFQADIPAKGKPVFVLTNRKGDVPAAPAKLTVEQTDQAITVTTGPARFSINRKAFNLLDGAWIDGNRNGKFEDGERVVTGKPSSGGVTQDTFGNHYLASAGTRSVEVVESGPMRVRVRARGQHVNSEGKGYKPGMYGFDVFMDFYAGSTDVFVDYIVTNNPSKSTGRPTIEDASVTLELSGAIKRYEMRAASESKSGALAGGESTCLYQDSNGAKSWAACPGFGFMSTRGYSYPSGTVTSFRGWKLLSRKGDAERSATKPEGAGEEVAKGDHARGLAMGSCAAGGVAVNVRNFWRLFPKAMEIGPANTVRVSVLPRETKVVHFLEDASSCGTEFVLRFFGGPKPPVDIKAWADRWDHRLIARPPMEHIAACGALAETGPFAPIKKGLERKPDRRVQANSKSMFSSDRLYGNAYGWQIWGERWRSNGGHGRRGARQPVSQDNYLWLWYTTGNHEWFRIGEARSRQFRDARVYRIENQDPFGFKDWNAFRVANRSEKWTKRPQPKAGEYAKYTAGAWKRTDWLFPNPEHTTLDLLYDRYLLFGDDRCLENMRIAAAHGGYFSGRGGNSISGTTWPWRANGWGWRALLRYWELTGDAAAEKCLADVIKRHSEYIGRKPFACISGGKTHWWFTQIYARAVAVTALQTGDPQALALCRTLADDKEPRTDGTDPKTERLLTLFTALHHLTGDATYKQRILKGVKPDELASLDRYWPACDYWLLQQKPRSSK